MPPREDSVLRRDIDLLGQMYRVVLVSFTVLDPIYDRLHAENNLQAFTAEAIPAIQTYLRDVLPVTWCQPQISAAARQVITSTMEVLTRAVGEAAEGVAQHLIGETPPALPVCVVGIFRQREGQSNYLLRLRANYAGGLVSHVLSHIAGPMLRSVDGLATRIFLDRNIRGGKGGKGGGKGKGKSKGKGRDAKGAKGNQGRGNRGTASALDVLQWTRGTILLLRSSTHCSKNLRRFSRF